MTTYCAFCYQPVVDGQCPRCTSALLAPPVRHRPARNKPPRFTRAIGRPAREDVIVGHVQPSRRLDTR